MTTKSRRANASSNLLRAEPQEKLTLHNQPKNPHGLFHLLKLLRPQLFVLTIVLTLGTLSQYGIIPPTPELIEKIEILFQRHGLPLVAICSFIENIVGINAYFPGSIAILAGMALTAGDPTRAFLTYLAIVGPAAAANLTCYLLGRRLNKDTAPALHDNAQRGTDWILFFLTYWHPHLAATTSFAAGSRKLALVKFLKLSAVVSLFWSALWGITIYHFGKMIDKNKDLAVLFYLYLALWTAWEIIKELRAARATNPSLRSEKD